MRPLFIKLSVGAMLLVTALGLWHPPMLWLYALILPLIGLGLYDMLQTKHTILRNFPLIGHFRYMLEAISPEIQQYFIERHTDGTPICRNHRAIVYERSKDKSPSHPYGTEIDPYSKKYIGLKHSIYPLQPSEEEYRVTVGGNGCRQPYSASLLNISAMSFGSISANAILAMGKGAKAGGFYQNTGEGSLSRYHLEAGGDIVWQTPLGACLNSCRD